MFKQFSESNLIWNSWLTERAVLLCLVAIYQSPAFPPLKTLTHFWTGVRIGHMYM